MVVHMIMCSRLFIWLTYNLRSGFLYAWYLVRFSFTYIFLVITLNRIYKLNISLFISLRDKYTHKIAFQNLLFQPCAWQLDCLYSGYSYVAPFEWDEHQLRTSTQRFGLATMWSGRTMPNYVSILSWDGALARLALNYWIGVFG